MGARFEILRTGMGTERAARALERRLSDASLPVPAAIISTGFAGSLTDGIEPGHWVAARIITAPAPRPRDEARSIVLGGDPVARALARSGLSIRLVTIHSASGVIDASGTGPSRDAQAVDMESFALAEIAGTRGIPFGTIRLISDSPSRPIPEPIRILSSLSIGGLAHRPCWMTVARALGSSLRSPAQLASFAIRGLSLSSRLEGGWTSLARTLDAALADAELVELGRAEHSP